MASIQPGAGTVPATRRLSDVPGPPGLPLIGNLLEIDTPRLHQILEEWSRQYGECFRFRITTAGFSSSRTRRPSLLCYATGRTDFSGPRASA